MEITHYPTLEEALHLHERMVERFGGTAGVRDLGLLDSVLARPRSGYYDTLVLQAAALMQSLARNHAFVDGNKRMAFALPVVFLRMNGVRFEADPDDAEAFLVDEVIRRQADLARMAAWLEGHLVRVT